MNKKLLKIIGLTIVGIIAAVYVLFLLLPLILNPVIKGYLPQISEEVQKNDRIKGKT